MKKGMFVFAIFLFASLSVVFVSAFCDQNQTIMQLSGSPTNAPGALWNYTASGTVISGGQGVEYRLTSGINDCLLDGLKSTGISSQGYSFINYLDGGGADGKHLCFWVRNSSSVYNYLVTSSSSDCSVSPPAGYAIVDKTNANSYSDDLGNPYSLCLWKKNATTPFYYSFSAFHSEAFDNCTTNTDSPPGTSLVSSGCLAGSEGSCNEELCFWGDSRVNNYNTVLAMNVLNSETHSFAPIPMYSCLNPNNHKHLTYPVNFSNIDCVNTTLIGYDFDSNTYGGGPSGNGFHWDENATGTYVTGTTDFARCVYVPTNDIPSCCYSYANLMCDASGICQSTPNTFSRIGTGVSFGSAYADCANVPPASQIATNVFASWDDFPSHAFTTQQPNTYPLYQCYNSTLNDYFLEPAGTICPKGTAPQVLGYIYPPVNSVNNYPICYDQIFNATYNGNNPHDCTSSNKVLWLNNITNAAASLTSSSQYNVPVCYGNLVCKNTTGNCSDFGSNFQMVAGLSQSNNSNVYAPNTSAPIEICCAPTASVVPTGNAYWSDMTGVAINTTDLWDTVKLNINGSVANGTVTYNIYQQCNGLSLNCLWALVVGNQRVAQVSGVSGFTTWIANQTGNYYFTANGNSTQSGILTVSSSVNDSAPVAVIVNPPEGSKHVVNEAISFEQASYDVDDDLNVTWNFGDGQTAAFSGCQSGTNCNVTHTYANQGVKVISLTAQEATRSGSDTKYRKIFVYDNGINPMADISSPPNGGNFIGPITINFDAENSFAANCTLLSDCVLPANSPTSLTSADCYNVSGSVGGTLVTYNCFNYPKSWIPSYYNLIFNWTVRDTNGNNFGDIYGRWSPDYSQAVNFSKAFNEQRQYVVKLKLGFENETA